MISYEQQANVLIIEFIKQRYGALRIKYGLDYQKIDGDEKYKLLENVAFREQCHFHDSMPKEFWPTEDSFGELDSSDKFPEPTSENLKFATSWDWLHPVFDCYKTMTFENPELFEKHLQNVRQLESAMLYSGGGIKGVNKAMICLAEVIEWFNSLPVGTVVK